MLHGEDRITERPGKVAVYWLVPIVENDLPAGAEELLTARSGELGSWDSDEADRPRSELAELGVVVRDDGKRRYWRLVST